jgi:hypothetical protein
MAEMKMPTKVAKNTIALTRPLFSTAVLSVRYSMLAGMPKPRVAPHRKATIATPKKFPMSIARGMMEATAPEAIQIFKKRRFADPLGKKAPIRAAVAVATAMMIRIERFS